MFFPLDVQIKLANIHCQQSDENNGAEPYLLTVFFKFDGETAWVDLTGLHGTATVIQTPGDRGNLNVEHVHSGDNVSVPSAIGEWRTTLQPIPVRIPNQPPLPLVAVGYVALLMEEDGSPDDLIARGHRALNDAVQRAVDGVIARVAMTRALPSAGETAKLAEQIVQDVKNAVLGDLHFSDLLGIAAGLGDMDDIIGHGEMVYGYDQLVKYGEGAPGPDGTNLGGMDIRHYWPAQGEWDLTGHVYAKQLIEFVPLTPNRLTPRAVGPDEAWSGTWHGILPSGNSPAVVVVITLVAAGVHAVDVREDRVHPAFTARVDRVEVSSTFVTAYVHDVWANLDSVHVVASHVVVPSGRMAALHRPLESSEIARTVAPAPQTVARVVDETSTHSPTHGSVGSVHELNALVAQLVVSPSLSLELYAEVTDRGTVDRYRVRYMRSRSDGVVVEDVMLVKYDPPR